MLWSRSKVLRDGAAAQYGSDAIAGIVNFKLKEASEGLSLHTSWGQTYHGDGDKVRVAANLGLPLTDTGFANFSFEFLNADETSRSVQRRDARALIEAGNRDVRRPAAQIWGAPEIQSDYKFFGNLGLDLEAIKARLYAFGNYAERGSRAAFSSAIPIRAAVSSGATRSQTARPPSGWPTCRTAVSAVRRSRPTRRPTTRAWICPSTVSCSTSVFRVALRRALAATCKTGASPLACAGRRRAPRRCSTAGRTTVSASFGYHSVDYFIHNTINPQLAAMRTAIPDQIPARRERAV